MILIFTKILSIFISCLRFIATCNENLKGLLLEIDSHFTCELVNKKYFYSRKDWFDGKIERFYLPDCLESYENKRINDIKNNDFKIILDQINK